MFNWSRFSALFLAAGIGIAEALDLVSNEPTVMRHTLMLAAVALIAGAASPTASAASACCSASGALPAACSPPA